MKQHINAIDLTFAELFHLTKETSPIQVGMGLELVKEKREIARHGGGFYSDIVIIRTTSQEPQYFRFMITTYLDETEEFTSFTKPYEVFKSVEKKELDRYSSWIEEKDEISN
ncbi:hypothetical protein ACOMCU_00560 [Lysinibacillus sp. UGB7]|uniref:hypothetical protein n=1 Tax=Lysinibacillus sp. UGB7 TaxID=3411039 RepID=UPI003B7858DB